jgi:hypothetical protein
LRRVLVAPSFEAWREAAREALQARLRPEEVNLADETAQASEAFAFGDEAQPSGEVVAKPHVPKEFLERAQIVATHREPSRWNLLYRLLWRLQSERELMRIEIDSDVAEFARLSSRCGATCTKCTRSCAFA